MSIIATAKDSRDVHIRCDASILHRSRWQKKGACGTMSTDIGLWGHVTITELMGNQRHIIKYNLELLRNPLS